MCLALCVPTMHPAKLLKYKVYVMGYEVGVHTGDIKYLPRLKHKKVIMPVPRKHVMGGPSGARFSMSIFNESPSSVGRI